jgi:hypothetical protein
VKGGVGFLTKLSLMQQAKKRRHVTGMVAFRRLLLRPYAD